MAKRPPSSGTAFENEVAATCLAYRSAGIARLERVSPPVRVLHLPGRSKPMIVMMENPFLDFHGAWTEMNGKNLVIECKSTAAPILKIQEDNGIKLDQLKTALSWESDGAAVAFLWRYAGGTRLVTPRMVAAQLRDRPSLRWCDAHPVPQGDGFIFLDFLALLRRLHNRTPQT